MKYFKISEFEKTNTGLNNKMSTEDIKDCEWFINNILDKIRERFGYPIYVNSGYRSAIVNTNVKGSTTSDHLSKGFVFASDLDTKGRNKELFELIRKMQKEGVITFKQLINEYNYR